MRYVSEIGRALVAKCAFVLMCVVGIAVVWNLPPPLSDISILIGLAWIVLTCKVLKWLVVRMGWSTREREGGPL